MRGLPGLRERIFPLANFGEDVVYVPEFFPLESADRYFEALRASIQWRHEEIVLFGRRVLVPRLIAWYGEPDAVYTYSGIRHTPHPWTSELLEMRDALERATQLPFNSVLLNLYRNGSDSVSWHADDEPELGPEPAIASVSLGVARRFVWRSKESKKREGEVCLEHGSVLLMKGRSQPLLEHALPKDARVHEERINLTFRQIS